MTFTFNLTTRASADAVLAVIRSHAAHWRESDVPPELRRTGTPGVEARVSGHRFSIHLQSRGETPSTEYVLRGEVRRRLGGGSRVRARAPTAVTERLVLALAAAPAVWLALAGHWWLAALVAAAGGGLSWWRLRQARSGGRDADVAFRHLAERLEAAVQAAEGDTSGTAI